MRDFLQNKSHFYLMGIFCAISLQYLMLPFFFFSGHAAATDMLAHFQGILDQVHVPELVQISMDGPNVNWKF